jgi:VWFA-related protein
MALLSHRQGWSCALVLSIFPCVFSASSASDPSATYHTGTSEVRITFFATDQSNRLVENIEKDDFAVVDSGQVIREFRSLARSNENALDVVALVDTSESVVRRFQATRHDVLQLVSQESLTGGDNVSVVTFSGLQPVLLCTIDCHTPQTEKSLLTLRPGGVTPLFDTLIYAADFVSRRQTPGVRPVLILFSDGNDTVSRTSVVEALEAVTAIGAPLYAIDLSEPRHDLAGSVVLQRMAETTGGRYFSVRDGVPEVLRAVLADQRASYVVTYQLPRQASGFHSLRILPKHNLNLRFHCRSGYYYERKDP